MTAPVTSRTPSPSLQREIPKLVTYMAIYLVVFSLPFLYHLLMVVLGLRFGIDGLLFVAQNWWAYYLLRGAVFVQGVITVATLWGKTSRYQVLSMANVGNAQIVAIVIITAIDYYLEGMVGMNPDLPLLFYILFPFVLHFGFAMVFAPKVIVVDLAGRKIEKLAYFWPWAVFSKSMPLSSVIGITTTRRWVRTSRSAGYHYDLIVTGAKRWVSSFVPNPILSMELDELEQNTGIKVAERVDKL